MSAPERTYEASAARVEEIIRRLDAGEAGLSETLELVREGRAADRVLRERARRRRGAISRSSASTSSWRGSRERRRRRDGLGVPRLATTFDGISHLRLEVEHLLARAARIARARPPGSCASTTEIALHGRGRDRARRGCHLRSGRGPRGAARAPERSCRSPVLLDTGARSPRTWRALELFPEPPHSESFRNPTALGASESAALDLALRQAGLPLHEALGLVPRAGALRGVAAAR